MLYRSSGLLHVIVEIIKFNMESGGGLCMVPVLNTVIYSLRQASDSDRRARVKSVTRGKIKESSITRLSALSRACYSRSRRAPGSMMKLFLKRAKKKAFTRRRQT